MIERITEYPGYLLRFKAQSPTKQALLLFHGFPAHRGTKNLDLAFWLHQALAFDVFVLHYRGLGESVGTFRFTHSLAEGVEVVRRLTEQMGYVSVRLVGHSWGGLVAVNTAMACSEAVPQIVLISPFCAGSKAEPLYDWFVKGVSVDVPGVFKELTDHEIVSEIDIILERHLPMDLAAKFPMTTNVSIIQAALDEVTPADRARALVERFPKRPRYVELNDDHSFMASRQRLAQTVISMLETSGNS